MMCALVGLTSRAESVSRTLVVTSIGPVSTQWVAHVTGWARTNLALPVMVGAPLAEQVKTIEAAIALGAQKRPQHQVGLVILIDPQEPSPAHGVLRPEHGVAIINVRAMQADGATAATVQARLERQVIRGICMLLGLESSPNPFSAMASYSSLAELDSIGRNLDPPWLVRLQKAALEKGLEPDRENPFYMLN